MNVQATQARQLCHLFRRGAAGLGHVSRKIEIDVNIAHVDSCIGGECSDHLLRILFLKCLAGSIRGEICRCIRQRDVNPPEVAPHRSDLSGEQLLRTFAAVHVH